MPACGTLDGYCYSGRGIWRNHGGVGVKFTFLRDCARIRPVIPAPIIRTCVSSELGTVMLDVSLCAVVRWFSDECGRGEGAGWYRSTTRQGFIIVSQLGLGIIT